MLVCWMALAGCSDDLFRDDAVINGTERISLAGEIDQVVKTRVNDNGFCDGDVMGVYIVDFNGNEPGELMLTGNRGDNVRHTFDEAAYAWNSAYDLYWKDKHTHIDVYGYYPFGEPESIEAYSFTVQRDQSTEGENGELGGYEASDFLWGKVADVAPTTNVIRLPMQHRMANARVTLVEGEGFATGEWQKTEKIVLATNLVREASINLADGHVTPVGEVEETATIPSRNGDEWRAIVVPQTVPKDTMLFSITIGGVPYKFSKKGDFTTYIAGKMNNFSIRVDKKEDTGKYTLTLISESITPWENDLVSHDAAAREYIVINSTAGHLKDSIIAANKDYTQVKNLKITGRINSQDFYFMRDSMEMLQSLNLKEVRVRGSFGYQPWFTGDASRDDVERDDVIPQRAFDEKSSLLRIVLPDTLEGIGERAFRSCVNLTGSIIIPEGVTRIGSSAFLWCTSLTGTLSLPSTLEYIGGGGAVDIHGAFCDCHFSCELKLPNNLKYIGHNVFAGNDGYYGNLVLPEKLEFIGDFAFANARNLTGNLKIPQGVSYISQGAFQYTGLNGTLQLHDGITGIQPGAFQGSPFKGDLVLPKDLTTLGASVFEGCDFSGELQLPKDIASIGSNAFAGNWRLMGTVEFPDGLQTIGSNAFSECRSLEGLVFSESIENIQSGAFNNCFGMQCVQRRGQRQLHARSARTCHCAVSGNGRLERVQAYRRPSRAGVPSVRGLCPEHRAQADACCGCRGRMGGAEHADVVRTVADQRGGQGRGDAHHQGYGQRLGRPHGGNRVQTERRRIYPQMHRDAV